MELLNSLRMHMSSEFSWQTIILERIIIGNVLLSWQYNVITGLTLQ